MTLEDELTNLNMKWSILEAGMQGLQREGDKLIPLVEEQ